MPETLRFYRRHLPHWLVAERTYFLTIRQKGTLPADVIGEFAKEREKLCEAKASSDKVLALLRRQFAKVEAVLHASSTKGMLTDAGVPQILLDNIDWLESDSRGWHVYAAVVMSTHMHIVMRNGSGRSAELLADLAQYKSFTARQINKHLKLKGSLWAREDFDHWCRTQEKVESAVRYVVENPIKAGLCRNWYDWSWVRLNAEWREWVEQTSSS